MQVASKRFFVSSVTNLFLLAYIRNKGNVRWFEACGDYWLYNCTCQYVFTHLLPYLLTHSITPWSRFLFEMTGSQLVKKFPSFCRTRKFINGFTTARHISLSLASSIQSMYPHPTSWIFILILSSYLHLILPNGLFPSCFPTNIRYAPLLAPIRATSQSSWFDTRKMFGEEYRSLCSLLFSFLRCLISLRRNIFLSTHFSKTFSVHSSFYGSDHVSHPYKTTGKNIVPCILIFIFLVCNLED
jgi:hypothetical protein